MDLPLDGPAWQVSLERASEGQNNPTAQLLEQVSDKSLGQGLGAGETQGQQAAHSNQHYPAPGATSHQSVACVTKERVNVFKGPVKPPPEDLHKSRENTEEQFKESPSCTASAMCHFLWAFH